MLLLSCLPFCSVFHTQSSFALYYLERMASFFSYPTKFSNLHNSFMLLELSSCFLFLLFHMLLKLSNSFLFLYNFFMCYLNQIAPFLFLELVHYILCVILFLLFLSVILYVAFLLSQSLINSISFYHVFISSIHYQHTSITFLYSMNWHLYCILPSFNSSSWMISLIS